jgi:hypothetical protein
MKKALAVLVTCVLAVGCSSMGSMADSDGVRAAALAAAGQEQIAWNQNARPSGMESVATLTRMKVHVDSVNVESPTEATVLATYKYIGKFNTDGGEKQGTLTVQRKLQFTKNGAAWTQNGTAQEVARSTSWSGTANS